MGRRAYSKVSVARRPGLECVACQGRSVVVVLCAGSVYCSTVCDYNFGCDAAVVTAATSSSRLFWLQSF